MREIRIIVFVLYQFSGNALQCIATWCYVRIASHQLLVKVISLKLEISYTACKLDVDSRRTYCCINSKPICMLFLLYREGKNSWDGGWEGRSNSCTFHYRRFTLYHNLWQINTLDLVFNPRKLCALWTSTNVYILK